MDDPDAKELLGPLHDFVGVWTNNIGEGWNLIAVPGSTTSQGFPAFFDSGRGFILETIPYIETTSYKPISVTLNRGTYRPGGSFGNPGGQEVQKIGAVLYEQRIESAGVDVLDPSNENYEAIKKFYEDRGFTAGTPLHAEQGMLLNMSNYQDYGNEDFQVARMGTIPHGNTMLCLGNAASGTSPNIDENQNNPKPTPVDPRRSMPVEYTQNTYDPVTHSFEGYPFYPDFIPVMPNKTLINANDGITFESTNQITLNTTSGTGGLLSIPFVGGGIDGSRIDTTKMNVDYWLSKYKDADGAEQMRMQYSQNINLVFPSSLDYSLPINWPHIGVNTLHRVSTDVK